jgi:hypothetical protein
MLLKIKEHCLSSFAEFLKTCRTMLCGFMLLCRTMHVQEDKKNKHPTELDGGYLASFFRKGPR